MCSNDDPFCPESVMLEREKGVNPRACFLPKANGTVQHLMYPNGSHTTINWLEGRAHKKYARAASHARQGGSLLLQAGAYLVTLL